MNTPTGEIADMPGYFSHEIQQPTNSATLKASLMALRDEVSWGVAQHHEAIVLGEIGRLTHALESIAKGRIPREEVKRYAASALPASRPDNSGLDDGPLLNPPRKKAAPKPPAVMAEIRKRAWATRRAKYGAPGHG